MMMADGCGNRQLVRLAQGDLKALLVLVFMGIFAYIAGKGLLSTPLNAFSNSEIFNLKIIGIKNYSLIAPSPIAMTAIIVFFILMVK